MVKRRHRKDDNQDEIIETLQAIGCDVEVIGRPVDLLVGFRARNFLIDVKNPENKSYSGTKGQKEFIKRWRGQVRIVHTPEEAVQLILESYRD